MTFDELLAENAALRAPMAMLMGKLSAIQASDVALAQELARLKRQTFGVKSERRHIDDKQTGLLPSPSPTRRLPSPRPHQRAPTHGHPARLSSP